MNTVSLNDWQCFSDPKGNASGFGLSKFITDSLLNEIKPLTQFNIIWFKSVCGFGTAVLSNTTDRKPLSRLNHHLSKSDKKSRLLIISNAFDLPAIDSKPVEVGIKKSGANRKHVTMSDYYRGYEICQGKMGSFSEILKITTALIECAMNKHKRLMMIRFDLKQSYYTDDSSRLSKFFKNLIRWIKRNYKTQEVYYAWAREIERAKKQHYHCMVLIDGDVIKKAKPVFDKVDAYWSDPRDSAYFVYHNNFKMYKQIKSIEQLPNAIYWGSYLAKARGKGYRPPQAKDYGASRLPINRSTAQETQA